MLSEQAAAKGLQLEIRTRGEIRPLISDAGRIRQVLVNFLSNALKFTAKGGITVTVRETVAGRGRRRLRMEVRDTGPGVPQEHIAQLFERFTQADVSVSRRYGGTGLGLAICKRTVELLDGSIGAESAEGQGSTFWFELVLPVATTYGAAPPEAVEPLSLDRPVRLLLVEDVAVNRELVQTLLRPFEVDVAVAENGLQAVEAVARARFDLILMDVQMPVMDGLTAAGRIRDLDDPNARATPIIAMTANVLPEQIRKCLDAGMDDHLGKPISPARLIEVLSRWSTGRHAVAKASPARVG
jgi:CheY-like chemotaxis protein